MAKKQTQIKKTPKKAREAKKHFIIYNNGGVLSATTPKDWARAHRNYFPTFSFIGSDNTPTVDTIENYLINNMGFSRIVNNEIVMCYIYIEI